MDLNLRKAVCSKLITVVIAGLTMLGAGYAGAQSGSKEKVFNLQLATYTGPTSADTLAYREWVKRIADLTKGTVNIEIFLAGSLLPATEILPGVAARRADLGAMSFFYYPAAVPLTFIVNLPYQTDNAPAEAKAFQDLFVQNKAYRNQYESKGVVNLFNWIAPTPPVLGCKKPVKSLADMKGRSVRVGGLIAAAFEPLGVQIVALAAGEVRQSVERGLIDCWAGLTMDLVPDLGLDEVTPYLYDWGWGNFGTYEMIINKGVWDSLSATQRASINQASAELIARYTKITDPAMAAVCKRIKKSSAQVQVLPESIQKEWRALAEKRVLAAYYALNEKNGIRRDVAEGFYNDFKAALARHEPNFPHVDNAIARCAKGEL